MSRVQTADIRTMTNVITTYAADLGLIPKDSRVQYYKGNQANGISASLEVVRAEGTPQRETIAVDFLPVYTYKTGREQQYRELTATYKVLMAMIRLQSDKYAGTPIMAHPSNG